MNNFFFPQKPFSGLLLPSPVPCRKPPKIFPVFIPFAGCKQRCIFCAQETQTGRKADSISNILAQADAEITLARQLSPLPLEVAFFGGTFTALPSADLDLCLGYAKKWRDSGLADQFRCSTRPDAVAPDILKVLLDHHVTTIELGIQSFSAQALSASKRGYTPETALEACRLVKNSGCSLGVQLLPGLPGQSVADAENDILQTAAAHADFVRLYPCLVIRGTPLALLWKQQLYSPWNKEETARFLASASLHLWHSDIPIIRMGVAQDAGLAEAILAGPWHASMGNAVRGTAIAMLLRASLAAARQKKTAASPLSSLDALSYGICRQLAQVPPGHTLCVPKRLQGDFWGYKKSLVPFYAHLNVTPESVFWWDHNAFFLPEKLLANLPADCHTLQIPSIFPPDEACHARN